MAASIKDRLALRFGKVATSAETADHDKEPREGDLIGDEDDIRHMRWREHWNARPPITELKPMTKPVHSVIVTYTDSAACDSVDGCDMAVRELQDIFQQKHKLPDIPYNFLVTLDGNVYEARGWDYRPFVPKKAFPSLRGSRIVIAQINTEFDQSLLSPADPAIWDLIQFGVNNEYIHPDARKLVSAPWI